MANISTFATSHGQVSVTDTAKEDVLTLLLLHGNSSSSKIWKHIFSSDALTSKYRIVALDLPGHGESEDALDPEKTYWMRGYAEVTKEILQTLNIKSIVVLGWSLGGHIGIELGDLLEPGMLQGLIMVGTPPSLGFEQTSLAFNHGDGKSLAAKQYWTKDEANEYSRSAIGEPFEQWMEDDARRTDGKARHLTWKRFSDGVGVDQRKVVQESNLSIAVINGTDDPFVDLEYVENISWNRLWTGNCIAVAGVGHAFFWEKPQDFELLLGGFLKDCEAS